jgi:hypothetical protein
MERRTSSRAALILNPHTAASPSVGAMSVESIFIMVVLPAPFGPSSPKISPCMTSNDNRSTAVTDSNRLVRLAVVIAFINHTKKRLLTAASVLFTGKHSQQYMWLWQHVHNTFIMGLFPQRFITCGSLAG